MRGTFLGELRHLALDHARVDPIAARLGALLGHFLQQQTIPLLEFGRRGTLALWQPRLQDLETARE